MSERPIVDMARQQFQSEAIEEDIAQQAIHKQKSEEEAAAQAAAEAQRIAEQKDPHGAKDPSQFGLGENLTELKNAEHA